MNGAASIAAVVLALVFGWAAVAKLVRHAQTVDAFGSLGVPAPGVLAVGVPVVELGLAVLLVARPAVGSAFALAMLAAFTLVVIRGVLRGSTSGCGCFGARRVEPVSAADVVRNGMLAGLAALGTATVSLVRPGWAAALAMTAALVAGVAAQAWARRHLGGRAPLPLPRRAGPSRTRA